MAVLLFENGPHKGKKIGLEEGVTYAFGTDPGCTVVLEDDLAAPVHFRIEGMEGIFFITDAGSPSGTLVNDEKRNRISLSKGDKIQAGATILSFTEEAAENGFTGKVIGGYKILANIGRGGMGRVFRAIQVSLDREVALKVLSPRLTRNPEFVRKFTEEARAAAALSHPNVIQVFDVGSDGNYHFYSMEYAAGGTVEDLINKGGPIPVQRAIRIVRDAAGGLLYAESLNLVHHDIKPQNLMIDKFDVTKIADMGLASSIESSEKIGGEIVGTPHFISPERIRRRELDIRSDIYSLGCTFYRILTGKTPFSGATTREILLKQLKEEPVPIREIRPDVPEKVCQVVERMMRKDPAERYPGIAALIEDLDSLKAGKKGRGLLAAALLFAAAAAAVTAYLLIHGGGAGKGSAPPPVPPAPAVKGGEKEPRLRKEMEDQQKKLAELEASNLFLSIPPDLAPPERLERLLDLVSRYPGTKTAERSGAEAEELRRRIALEKKKAEEHDRLVAAITSRSEKKVRESLAAKRFHEAMTAAAGAGAAERMESDPAVAALRRTLGGEVRKAAGEYAAGLLAAADEALSRKDFAAAREAAAEGIAAFSPPARPGPAGEEAFPFLEEKRKTFEAKAAAVEAARRAERAALFDKDLEALLAWEDPRKEREGVLGLFAAAAKPPPAFATEEYASYAGRIAAAVGAGRDLVARFKKAVAEKNLEKDAVVHPTRGDSCTILGLGEGGASLRLLASGTSIVTVPLGDFSRPKAFIDLMENRFPMTGADLVSLARATLIVAAARASAGFDPLEEAIAAYEKDKGWSEACRESAGKALAPDTGFFESLEKILAEASARDPSLEEQCRALLAAALREKNAMEALEDALGPFKMKNPGLRFKEAADALRRFDTEYTDTFFFRYAGGLTGGSLRPGGHLVEFEP